VKIVHFVIKRSEIQLAVIFWIVKINNVAYEELFNLSVDDNIREMFFEKLLIIILTK
jgi:hypothetical protein